MPPHSKTSSRPRSRRISGEEEIWDVSEWIGLHAVRPLVTPTQARSLRRVEPVAFAQGLLPGQKHPPRERIQV